MDACNGSPLRKLFRQYKEFCLSHVFNVSDKDEKIALMKKVIGDLLDQNEQLLEMIAEVEQCADLKTDQLRQCLIKTADATSQIGLTLSSYEIDLKKIVQYQIPSFIECGDLLQKVNSYIDVLESENNELKQQNDLLFQNVKHQNVELVQYKNIVCNLIDGTRSFSPLSCFSSNFNVDYLEVVLENKLLEEEKNVTDMVCANLLDELIYSIEVNNMPCFDVEDEGKFGEKLSAIDYQNGVLCDINDNYEIDELEWINSWSTASSLDHKSSYTSLLDLLSTILNELKLKNSVIFDMRRQLVSSRSELSNIQYEFCQKEIEILNAFIELKNELTEQDHNSANLLRLIEDLEQSVKQNLLVKDNAPDELSTVRSVERLSLIDPTLTSHLPQRDAFGCVAPMQMHLAY